MRKKQDKTVFGYWLLVIGFVFKLAALYKRSLTTFAKAITTIVDAHLLMVLLFLSYLFFHFNSSYELNDEEFFNAKMESLTIHFSVLSLHLTYSAPILWLKCIPVKTERKATNVCL